MKKSFLFLISILFLVACRESVDKPNNLISEDKMADIIYDLSLLEAIRLSDPISLEENKIDASKYVYRKYKIDSLQFARSDRYYAANVDLYANIYDRVSKKIEKNKKVFDSLKEIKPEIPKEKLQLRDETKKQLPSAKRMKMRKRNTKDFQKTQ